MAEYSIARRAAFLGSLVTGIIGIVAALNAMLSDDYVGAGVCLVASAMAFAAVGYLFKSA